MKAAVVSGPDESPVCADFPEPVADDRHRMVELVAAGVHPVMRSLIAGQQDGSAVTWPAGPASTPSRGPEQAGQ